MRTDDILQDFVAEAEERFLSIENQLVTLERHPQDAQALAELFRAAHSLKGTCSFLGFRRLAAIAHAAEDLLMAARERRVTLVPVHIGLVLAALDVMRDIVSRIVGEGGSEDASPAPQEAEITEALHGAAHGEDFTVPQTARAMRGAPLQGGLLRVQGDVFDNLLALSAEMGLVRGKMQRLGRQPAAVETHLAQLTARLQSEVLRARLQPVMEAWRSLPRLVRDMAAEAGISARLETSGGDTLLDRQVLDLLRDPLAHLVRNSLSHGIERPDMRRARGKPDTGVITIAARAADGQVILTVSDDGGGLDLAAIAARAQAQGLIPPARQGALPPQDIADMIFRRGFSTAAQISDMAGRGVGLDAVRTQVENFGGSVTVEASAADGGGAVFTIRVPLTLAMMPVALVAAAGQRFAVPRANIAEICLLPPQMDMAGGRPIFYWRGAPLPVLSLPQVLAAEEGAVSSKNRYGIIVQAEGMCAVLAAEEILSIAEAVIKPLPPLIDSAGLYLGLVLLDDGFAALVPDVRRVLLRQHVRSLPPPSATPEKPRPQRDMIFFSAARKTFAMDAARVRHICRVQPDMIRQSQDGGIYACVGADVYPARLMSADSQADIRRLILLRSGEAILCSHVDDVKAVDEELCTAGIRMMKGQAVEVISGASDTAPQGRILLVDDSPFFCSLLAPLLRDAGYHVEIAGDAAAALALRDGGSVFDVIISDIEMPAMDGLDFARRIRDGDSAWRRTPLLALSAHATRQDEQRGRAAGFDDFITKFDRSGLLQKISALREGR